MQQLCRYNFLILLIVGACFAGVEKNGNLWIINENSINVEVNENNFAVDISTSNGSVWEMDRNRRSDEIEINGSSYSLSDAQSKQFERYEQGSDIGVKAILTGFPGASEVELHINIYIDRSRGECVIELDPVNDPGMAIGECCYPRGFQLENSWSSSFVNPAGNGGYGALENLNSGKTMSEAVSYAHGKLYMAWWGLLRDYDRNSDRGEGLLAMVASPYDFSLGAYTESGKTVPYGRWHKSLGRLRYKRRMCYVAYSTDGGYVRMCKRYRQFLIAEGRYRTFEEKARINPNIRKMKGMAQFTRYITQCHDADNRTFYQTFQQAKDETEQFLNRFNTKPTLFVHVREWHEGELSEGGTPYDLNVNGPNLRAGGWEGLKVLADWCDQTDNFLYMYDTYNDIVKSSKLSLYSTELVVRLENTGIWGHNWWCGNERFATVCPVKRMQLFKHNVEVLKQHGIDIKANYMDITVIREPLECYNTEHSHGEYGAPETGHLSKEGYCRAIEDFYNWCAESGIIVLSEHPCEWAWPFVLGSFFILPKGSKISSTTYVPLLHLVAHDAITGGEYVDTYHTGDDPRLFMQHLLHGIFPIPRENVQADAIWTERICNLHREVAFKQMVDHEFVDGESSVQRTTFENGTTVEVNYKTGDYVISNTPITMPDSNPPMIPKNVGVRKLP